MTPTDPTAPPERTGTPATPTTAPRTHDNYWLSSLELRRGVEMEVLGMRHVPGEVLREFLRMHRAWENSRPPANPDATRGTVLDVTFEADGSVTIPGDLLSAGD